MNLVESVSKVICEFLGGNIIDRSRFPFSVSKAVRMTIALEFALACKSWLPARITFALFSTNYRCDNSTDYFITGRLSPVSIASLTIALPSTTSMSQEDTQGKVALSRRTESPKTISSSLIKMSMPSRNTVALPM